MPDTLVVDVSQDWAAACIVRRRFETVNPSGEEWGLERIRKAAVESKARDAEDLVEAIFTSLDKFSRGRQADDATLAVLRVH